MSRPLREARACERRPLSFRPPRARLPRSVRRRVDRDRKEGAASRTRAIAIPACRMRLCSSSAGQRPCHRRAGRSGRCSRSIRPQKSDKPTLWSAARTCGGGMLARVRILELERSVSRRQARRVSQVRLHRQRQVQWTVCPPILGQLPPSIRYGSQRARKWGQNLRRRWRSLSMLRCGG